jgi:hypothetical protein
MKLYRYEKVCNHETLLDRDNNSNVKVVLREYNVIRITPKGYVIFAGYKEKWVSATGKKCFARQIEKQALEDFIRRTNRSIWIMKHYIEFSELALKETDKLNNQ